MARLALLSLALASSLLLQLCGYCETSIYPGLRRKPQLINQPFEMSSDFLSQLMEENARRRLQQQFEQQLELINMQMDRQRQKQQERYRQLQEHMNNDNSGVEETVEYDNMAVGEDNRPNYEQYDDGANENALNRGSPQFSYKYKTNEIDSAEAPPPRRLPAPFAVGPEDPRYFEVAPVDDVSADDDIDPKALEEYEEYVPVEGKPIPAGLSPPTVQLTAIEQEAGGPIVEGDLHKAVEANAPAAATTTYHRIKPQPAMAAGAAPGAIPDLAAGMKPVQNHPEIAGNTRHDITALIEKLQKEGKTEAILNTPQHQLEQQEAHSVVRQHLGIDGDMGVYVVALIAGVSAAITVGLIALGIAWYTLHNKTKAAADVDYPAYGVTGPNKDVSPSGDRKLAQSAQMYHYQHQKQQIIAMENRQAVEGSCGLSDVESDDDNEEGDYTVYECPGLAPTGEMEVKNPLFLDETPLTPAGSAAVAAPASGAAPTIITQATPQQPPTVRKNSGKVTTSSATNSDAKPNKKNKK